MRDGDLLAVIVRKKGGDVDDIGVVVLGPPSNDLADALETAATAYRRGIRGH